MLFSKLMLKCKSCSDVQIVLFQFQLELVCWFAYAVFAKRLRLGFLTSFFYFLRVISVFVTIGKCSLLYSQLLLTVESCDLCMS